MSVPEASFTILGCLESDVDEPSMFQRTAQRGMPGSFNLSRLSPKRAKTGTQKGKAGA